ncbi:S24 family peptidase [Geothrix sp. PMB-07]|uniref:LexA family transcriptional regulator n=1 Tax=Geothrix sp. PMB-07 TaxID=3068640 RepID=UPI0027418797|nr:S24 family peptidase [Geothrix sp. PMB-07]WLT32257.1 S24 family peptidase [Geothrix sp. PMB-07]
MLDPSIGSGHMRLLGDKALLATAKELEKKSSRLRYARQYLKLSGAAFGAPIGKAKGTISQWEAGSVDFSLSDSLAIEHVWGISSPWLMANEGDMFSSRTPRLYNRTEHGVFLLPLLDGLPSCGPSGEIADLGEDAEGLPFGQKFIGELLRQCGAGSEANLFVARVQGDSMNPTILAGDTVMVNTALPLRLEPKKGALHLVRRRAGSSEARVKRVFLSADGAHLTMNSDNPTYPPLTVPVDGVPIQDLIVGRVCWYGRSLLDQAPKAEDW